MIVIIRDIIANKNSYIMYYLMLFASSFNPNIKIKSLLLVALKSIIRIFIYYNNDLLLKNITINTKIFCEP